MFCAKRKMKNENNNITIVMFGSCHSFILVYSTATTSSGTINPKKKKNKLLLLMFSQEAETTNISSLKE